MAQYIDKDALVAEIERRKQVAFGWMETFGLMETAPNDAIEAEFELCDDILSFIDTLESKEVDLENEIDAELRKRWYGEYLDIDKFHESAKHFFELGLNVQQNISIDATNIDKVIEENGVDPNSKEAKIFKESYYMALEKLKTQKGE